MAVIKSAQSSTITRQAMVLDMSDLGRQAQRMLENARLQAEQIVNEARAKAQALIDGAEERGFAQGIERGLAEGREIGRRDGYQQAINDWSQRFEQLHASLTAALQDWENRREQMLHEAAEDMIALAVEVAGRVTHRIAQADPTIVRDQVAAALKLTSKPSAIEIVIHPQQRELIEANMPQLIAAVSSCQHASVREDESLTPGGCVINTAGGRVDASIETQLRRIAECFGVADAVARRSASCDAAIGLSSSATIPAAPDEAEGNSTHDAERRATNDAERRATDLAEHRATLSDGGEPPRQDDVPPS